MARNRRTAGQIFKLRLHRFNPILCRLLARYKGGRPFTVGEISAQSGLSESLVVEMSHLPSWNDVTMERFLAFTNGCGLDLLDSTTIRRAEAYLRDRPSFRYLKRDKLAWNTIYKPLIGEWRWWQGKIK